MFEYIEFPELTPEARAANEAARTARLDVLDSDDHHVRICQAAFLREAVFQAFPGYRGLPSSSHSLLEMADNLHNPLPPEAQQGIGLTPSSSVDIPPVCHYIEEGTLGRIRQALGVAADSAHELAQHAAAGSDRFPLSKMRLREGFLADQAESLDLLKLLPDPKS